MYGIFGIVVDKEQTLSPRLVKAAEKMTRGGNDYISAATMGKSQIDLRNNVGGMNSAAARLDFGTLPGLRGIIQICPSTIGEAARINTQPHLDSDGNLVGAQNCSPGYKSDLQDTVMADGLAVPLQHVDETCIHTVKKHLNHGKGIFDAVRLALNDHKGNFACVIGRIHEDCLYAVNQGSDLVAGLGEGFTCVSSDLSSILPLTHKIIRIRDGEIITLWADRVELRSICDGLVIQRKPETINDGQDAAHQGGFPHFMLKEIHEQPQAVREVLQMLVDNNTVESILEKIRKARQVYFLGCGTSSHACVAGSIFFAQLAHRSAIPVLATQFVQQYLPAVNRDDVGIFVSQSGETTDVLNSLAAAKAGGMTCFGLTNVNGSALTRETEAWLPLCSGSEVSVPATKTFTNQVVTFLSLAHRLADLDIAQLDEIPSLIKKTLELVEPQVNRLAPQAIAWNDLYCLGYGNTFPIALEGALKLKETTYSHCEGMLLTEFRHGPISAVTKGYPVMFITGLPDVPLFISGINEVTRRGGRAIVIGPEDPSLRASASDLIVIPPATPMISALLAVLPLQLLSYNISVARGFDPDRPRNLTKAVTNE